MSLATISLLAAAMARPAFSQADIVVTETPEQPIHALCRHYQGVRVERELAAAISEIYGTVNAAEIVPVGQFEIPFAEPVHGDENFGAQENWAICLPVVTRLPNGQVAVDNRYSIEDLPPAIILSVRCAGADRKACFQGHHRRGNHQDLRGDPLLALVGR